MIPAPHPFFRPGLVAAFLLVFVFALVGEVARAQNPAPPAPAPPVVEAKPSSYSLVPLDPRLS